MVIENPNKYDDWIPRDTTYNDGGFISEPVGRYVRNPWDLFSRGGVRRDYRVPGCRP